jgi:glutamate formiminotransferase
LRLASRAHVQVSMNLVDLDTTGLEAACTAVRDRVEDAGARVARVELVGLVPATALAACSPAFRRWSGISERQTIEARVAPAGGGAAGGGPGGGRARRA